MHVLEMQILAGMMLLGAASLAAPARADECMTDWGTAGEIVRREKLMTVQQLTQTDTMRLPGTVVRTTLCKVGDDYVYKLVVRGVGGALKNVVVDARIPMPSPLPKTVPAAAASGPNDR